MSQLSVVGELGKLRWLRRFARILCHAYDCVHERSRVNLVLRSEADNCATPRPQLETAYQTLRLKGASPRVKYSKIEDVVKELQRINSEDTIPVATISTISERLCLPGLEAAVPRIFEMLPREWKRLGDFSVLGTPFNPIISVKSFKARERLVASGSGQSLSPVYGWGLFNDPSEWGENRVRSYLYRGFYGLYLPGALLEELKWEWRGVLNLNGRRLLRPLSRFVADLKRARRGDRLDVRLL